MLLTSASLRAQTPQEADTLFKTNRYSQAMEVYKKLLKAKPKNDLYNFRIAQCAYELKDFEQAITYFQKTSDKYPLKNYYLGEIFFDNYRFDESVQAFMTYLEKFNPEDTQITTAQRKLKQAELGAKFLKRIEDVEIVDSMVVDKKDFLNKIPVSTELGSLKQMRLKLPGGSETDKIEYITQRGDRTWFSDTIGGQSDLFTSYKLLDRWAPAEKQITINTPDNENYPFLMLDGVTLCFASDGEGSLGGYDIFITRFNTDANKFLPAENVGMPFNSPFNDYMMIVDELRKVGWFVSDRYQPRGKVAVYQFIPNVEKKIIRSENPDTLIRFARAEVFSKSAKDKRIKSGYVAGKQISQPENRIIVCDSVVYSNAADFRSPDAREAYLQLQTLQSEYDAAKSELEGLRETYARSSDDNVRTSTGENILNLEAKLRELRPKIDALTLKWRNDEIKFLQNSLDKSK